MEAKEEICKNEQTIKQLLRLLKIAYHERDEARDQLQLLINKFLISTEPDHQIITTTTTNPPPIGYKFPTTTLEEQSENMMSSSETLISQIYGCNSNYNNNNNLGVYYSIQGCFPDNMMSTNHSVFVQQQHNNNNNNNKKELFSIAFENLIRGKPLPEKGKFLQAVVESGPLLQALLVAPLPPKWRIPPPPPLPPPPSSLFSRMDFRNSISAIGTSCGSQNSKKAVSCKKYYTCSAAVQSSPSTSSHLDEIPYGVPSGSCLKDNGKHVNGGGDRDFVKTKSQWGVEECKSLMREVKKECVGIK